MGRRRTSHHGWKQSRGTTITFFFTAIMELRVEFHEAKYYRKWEKDFNQKRQFISNEWKYSLIIRLTWKLESLKIKKSHFNEEIFQRFPWEHWKECLKWTLRSWRDKDLLIKFKAAQKSNAEYKRSRKWR